MTQEERYKNTINELSKYKNNVESKIYQDEKFSIITELNTTKDQISALKNSYSVDLVELQSNRNRLLKINKDINKYSSSEQSEEMQEEINKLNEEKEQINNWFSEQDSIKKNVNNQLVLLLIKQEELSKNLIQIESLINKFNKKNPPMDVSINPNNTLEELTAIEAKYNTEEFNEEEYNIIKEKFKNEQELIDSIIEQANTNLNNSKLKYEEALNKANTMNEDNNQINKRNLNKELKNYEREYNIWNQTTEEVNKLKIEHQYIDENNNVIDNIVSENEQENIAVVDPEPVENNELSLSDIYNIEEQKEENSNLFVRIQDPRVTTLSEEALNNINKIVDLIVTGQVHIEGNLDVTLNNFIVKKEQVQETPTIEPENNVETPNIEPVEQEEPTIEPDNNIETTEIETPDQQEETILEVPKIEESTQDNPTIEPENNVETPNIEPVEQEEPTIEPDNNIETTEIETPDQQEETILEVPKIEESIQDNPTIETEDNIETTNIEVEQPTIEEKTILEIPKIETQEDINLDSLAVDITNNEEAREKIKNINNNLSRIVESVKTNVISQEEGLNEITNLSLNDQQEIGEIVSKYDNKELIASIINDNNKRNELTKLGLGKTKEKKELTDEEIKEINKLNNEDYTRIIIRLINIMQYEKTTNEINNLSLGKSK